MGSKTGTLQSLEVSESPQFLRYLGSKNLSKNYPGYCSPIEVKAFHLGVLVHWLRERRRRWGIEPLSAQRPTVSAWVHRQYWTLWSQPFPVLTKHLPCPGVALNNYETGHISGSFSAKLFNFSIRSFPWSDQQQSHFRLEEVSLHSVWTASPTALHLGSVVKWKPRFL